MFFSDDSTDRAYRARRSVHVSSAMLISIQSDAHAFLRVGFAEPALEVRQDRSEGRIVPSFGARLEAHGGAPFAGGAAV